MRRLHRQGRRAICYLDVGSWESYRPDAGRFPRSVIGRRYEGFPDERWLDIRRFHSFAGAAASAASRCAPARASTRSSPTTSPAGKTRPASPSPAADQLRFNRWIARQVHARGMAVALKNDGRQVKQLVGRLRLRDRRAVLPVRRMRPLPALRANRQGRLRGRVRTRPRPSSAPPPGRSTSARSASPTTSSPGPGNRAIRSLRARGSASGRDGARKRAEGGPMGFDQYHEPPDELSAETRTFARLCASLTEEAEAIGWYEQRLAVEPDAEARGDHARRPGGGVQALRDGPRVPPAPHPALAADLRGRPLPGRRHRRARRGGRGRSAMRRRPSDRGGPARWASAASRGRNDEPPTAKPGADHRLRLGAARRRGRSACGRAAAAAGRLPAPGWSTRPPTSAASSRSTRRPPTASPPRSAVSCRWSSCGPSSRSRRAELADNDRGAVDADLEPLDEPPSGSRSPRTSPSSTAGPRPASPASPTPRRSKRSRSAPAPRATRARSPARSRRCARSGSKGPTGWRSAPTSTPG